MDANSPKRDVVRRDGGVGGRMEDHPVLEDASVSTGEGMARLCGAPEGGRILC